MPAAQHQRCAGLGYAGDQLSQCKARFHIAAHRVQQHQKPLDAGVLLHGHQLRDDVLVLRGLLALGCLAVALHLADDGQAVDDMGPLREGDGAKILNILFLLPVLVRLCLVCHRLPPCADRFLPAFPAQGLAMHPQERIKIQVFSEIFSDKYLTLNNSAVYFI